MFSFMSFKDVLSFFHVGLTKFYSGFMADKIYKVPFPQK